MQKPLNFLELINFEILEEANIESTSFELELIEMKYINQFDSIWRGFNGYHAIYFKLSNWLQYTKNKDEENHVKKLMKINEATIKELSKCKDTSKMWLLFNLGRKAEYEVLFKKYML